MDLSKLGPVAGSRRKRKRVGLGEGSGHGKTSSRGGKGQTARTGGGVRAGFEGGQMPLNRRVPKYGFVSMSKVTGRNVYRVVNVSDLESFADGTLVDGQELEKKGLVKGLRTAAGVQVLAKGRLTKKLNLKVAAISKAAKVIVEQAGGSVELVKRESGKVERV